MAQIPFRGNTQQMAFPLLSKLSSRTVIDQGIDQTYIQKVSAEESVPTDRGTPGAYYCHNIMPSTYGWQSVGYTKITGPSVIPPGKATYWMKRHTNVETGAVLTLMDSSVCKQGNYIFAIGSPTLPTTRGKLYKHINYGEWEEVSRIADTLDNSYCLYSCKGRLIAFSRVTGIGYIGAANRQSWERKSFPTPATMLIEEDRFFHIGANRDVRETFDFGVTWKNIGKFPPGVNATASVVKLEDWIYAAGSTGLFSNYYLTKDRGKTWVLAGTLNSALPSTTIANQITAAYGTRMQFMAKQDDSTVPPTYFETFTHPTDFYDEAPNGNIYPWGSGYATQLRPAGSAQYRLAYAAELPENLSQIDWEVMASRPAPGENWPVLPLGVPIYPFVISHLYMTKLPRDPR